MSSYSCVALVDWSLLWDDVVPGWLSLLAGSTTPAAFYARYAPAGVEYGDLLLEERYAASDRFLSLFPAPLHPPYLRSSLHESTECREFIQGVDTTAFPSLLEEAIKQHAAANISVADPYAGDHFAFIEGRFGKKPVAGTKNLFSFLEAAFEVRYDSEAGMYRYSRRKEGTSRLLHELFECLFLYQRVIPGTWFPIESPIWPGFDDLSFAGYLSPGEVKSLYGEIMHWESRRAVEDELFPLFAERVKRAAESEYGLLTIHAGL